MDFTASYYSLRTNQRNIYTYYLAHKKKYKNSPCYLPRNAVFSMRPDDYMKAIDSLESRGLISVDRSSPYYTQWIICDPK